jgi:hypothetical protein
VFAGLARHLDDGRCARAGVAAGHGGGPEAGEDSDQQKQEKRHQMEGLPAEVDPAQRLD